MMIIIILLITLFSSIIILLLSKIFSLKYDQIRENEQVSAFVWSSNMSEGSFI